MLMTWVLHEQPSLLHGSARLAPIFAWTGPPPVFGGNIFTHPLHCWCLPVKGRRDLCCLASETSQKNTRFRFLMHYLLISMHCIICYMALDRLSCCKCLLVYVTFFRTHWSVDGPRIAPKVLTEHLNFKFFLGGMPTAPLVCITSSMA